MAKKLAVTNPHTSWNKFSASVIKLCTRAITFWTRLSRRFNSDWNTASTALNSDATMLAIDIVNSASDVLMVEEKEATTGT
jgi:hypothetical protein